MKKILILSLTSLLFIGCGSTKVVFVDTQANLVRIGPDVSGKVYIQKNMSPSRKILERMIKKMLKAS